MSIAGLSIAQAAEELGVSTRTVRRFIKSGKIKASLVQGSFGEEYRISELPVGLQKKRPADNTPIRDNVQGGSASTTVQSVVQTPVQSLDHMMGIVRDLQDKNMALAAQLGAATERIRNLEKEVMALTAPRHRPWWQRLFGRKGYND